MSIFWNNDNVSKILIKNANNYRNKEIVQTLEKINMNKIQIIEIKGDGNCFYRYLMSIFY